MDLPKKKGDDDVMSKKFSGFLQRKGQISEKNIAEIFERP